MQESVIIKKCLCRLVTRWQATSHSLCSQWTVRNMCITDIHWHKEKTLLNMIAAQRIECWGYLNWREGIKLVNNITDLNPKGLRTKEQPKNRWRDKVIKDLILILVHRTPVHRTPVHRTLVHRTPVHNIRLQSHRTDTNILPQYSWCSASRQACFAVILHSLAQHRIGPHRGEN
jgi:hypothetical protein